MTYIITYLLFACTVTGFPLFSRSKSTNYIAKYDDIHTLKHPSKPATIPQPYNGLTYANFAPQSTPQCPFTPASGNTAIVSPQLSSGKTPSMSINSETRSGATFDLQSLNFGCAVISPNATKVEFCFLSVTGKKAKGAPVSQQCAWERPGKDMDSCVFSGGKWQGLQSVTFGAGSVPKNSVVVLDDVKYVTHT